MRWSIVRLIWVRELRDQLRDRRTLFMIAVLPLMLYPLLGMGVIQFALGFVDRPSFVGVAGAEHLPPEWGPLALATWAVRSAPSAAGPGLTPADLLGTAAAVSADHFWIEYPPLLTEGRFASLYFEHAGEAATLWPRRLGGDAWEAALEGKEVDLVLLVPPGFGKDLERGRRPALRLVYREGDDRSRLASNRLYAVLNRWRQHLRMVRLMRAGLPAHYDDPFDVYDAEKSKTNEKLAAEGLFEILVRIFPFLLVMWSLAGALYPAIDLCAGEKERGTMETLLISPASREEIVWGKFLTIWVFSAATALLNLVSMGITTWQLSGQLVQGTVPTVALLWSVVLVLPLSAFFSAVCLALGAYARSSKEGQYYLMPLFLLTMPFVFLTLAPGVELNQFYSLVPITGVALLMQELMSLSLEQVRWLYFFPVLASSMLYSWLALRWAIEQFRREEVLFREAERLDLGLWLRRLLREKEALPSTGQAVFCFFLILFLHWFSLGLGGHLPPMVRVSVAALAFVAAPPLFMALFITGWPSQALRLRQPTLGTLAAAVALAGLLLLPLAELTQLVLRQFPAVQAMLGERGQALAGQLRGLGEAQESLWQSWRQVLLVLLVPALCEELAFRGFILTGLRRRFGPWTAILLCSFLFALYHMNVFQVLPAFVLGVALGILSVRSGSVLPGMLFHVVNSVLVVGLTLVARFLPLEAEPALETVARPIVALVCAGLAAAVLAAVGYRLTPPRREPKQPAEIFLPPAETSP